MLKAIVVFPLFLFSFSIKSQENNPRINSAEIISKGIELHDQGKYKEAIKEYKKIDRSDTNYYQALYELAYSLSADSQAKEAVRICELGLGKNNEYWPQFYTVYGNLLDDLGQSERALKVYDSAIALYPAYTQLYLNKGTTYLILNNHKAAEEIFKTCILINPYESSAHYKLGVSAFSQGKITESFLCFIHYMLIQPGGKFQKNCINYMSLISKNADEIKEAINQRDNDYDSPFSLVERIILSKIALDKNYKPLIKLDDQVTRQVQVLCEKLEYDESSDNFWMQYYAPLLVNLFRDNKFEPFIYRIFSDLKIDAIQDYLKKNKSAQQDLINVIVAYYNNIRYTRELNYVKRSAMKPVYQFDNGKLFGKGAVSENGELFTGEWEFYYNTGNLRSKGKYNSDGTKEGDWKYYHFNGILRGQQSFKNGKQEGEEIFYFDNGNISSKAMVKNGEAEGDATNYYYVGTLSVAQHFNNGKLDGVRKTYFSNGNMKVEETYKADSLDGFFKSYYNTGIVESTGTYVNGKLEGPFKAYYDSGKVSREGQYKNGQLEGELKRYHTNGKLKSKENYIKGELEGPYTEYYDNGTLHYNSNFKKGKQDGVIEYFDYDNKKYSVFNYDNGIVKVAKYFDKSGKEIAVSERKSRKLDLVTYSSLGFKKSQAVYSDKGVTEGLETNYFASGKISSEINFENGFQNGVSTTYYPNGKKESEIMYTNGSKNGYATYWYFNGLIQAEGWYEDDSKEGAWLEYDDIGNLETKTTYLNNDMNGYKEEYYLNGKVSNVINYNVGWVESFIQYDTTGKEINRIQYKNSTGKAKTLLTNAKLYSEYEYYYGDLNGANKFYYPDGKLSAVQFYKRGIIDSTYTSYFHNGKVSIEGSYKNGKRTGTWKNYLENGKLNYTEEYVDGNINGKKIYYFENGKIDYELPFDEGYKHGWAKKYDPDGSLLYQVNFIYDIPTAYTYPDKSGKLLPEISLQNGNGSLKAFFANGNASAEYAYADNQLNGPNKLYYSNGKPRKISTENYNYTEGPYKYYHPNGQIELDYNFINNNLHGEMKIYNEKGVITESGIYYHGLAHGPYKYFDDTGKLTETRTYYYGILLDIKK